MDIEIVHKFVHPISIFYIIVCSVLNEQFVPVREEFSKNRFFGEPSWMFANKFCSANISTRTTNAFVVHVEKFREQTFFVKKIKIIRGSSKSQILRLKKWLFNHTWKWVKLCRVELVRLRHTPKLHSTQKKNEWTPVRWEH